MRQDHVRLVFTPFLAVSVVTVSLAAQTPGAAKPAAKSAPAVGHTPWGDPDLQGVWNFATMTPMERPAELANKATLTEAEAAEFLKAEAKRNNRDTNVGAGEVGDYNNLWYDRGNGLVDTRRTSLVVNPADGKIPPVTPEVQKKNDAMRAARKGVDDDAPTPGGWVEEIGPGSLRVRCILGFNVGPPMTPSAYNNNMQIVQSPGYVFIANEMNHHTRVVPLGNRPRTGVKRWMGDSRGRWEGETLVVETTNFLGPTMFTNSGPNLHLVERFTRDGKNRLVYRATLTDPSTWTKPWTYEVPMAKSDPPFIYEYACHEGNNGLVDILAGARAKERAAATKR